MSIDKDDIDYTDHMLHRGLIIENMDEVNIKKKVNSYLFLGEQDKHVINLIHWIDYLQDFQNEVRSTEMDKELEEEIHNIQLRLIKELGMRITHIFP